MGDLKQITIHWFKTSKVQKNKKKKQIDMCKKKKKTLHLKCLKHTKNALMKRKRQPSRAVMSKYFADHLKPNLFKTKITNCLLQGYNTSYCFRYILSELNLYSVSASHYAKFQGPILKNFKAWKKKFTVFSPDYFPVLQLTLCSNNQLDLAKTLTKEWIGASGSKKEKLIQSCSKEALRATDEKWITWKWEEEKQVYLESNLRWIKIKLFIIAFFYLLSDPCFALDFEFLEFKLECIQKNILKKRTSEEDEGFKTKRYDTGWNAFEKESKNKFKLFVELKERPNVSCKILMGNSLFDSVPIKYKKRTWIPWNRPFIEIQNIFEELFSFFFYIFPRDLINLIYQYVYFFAEMIPK